MELSLLYRMFVLIQSIIIFLYSLYLNVSFKKSFPVQWSERYSHSFSSKNINYFIFPSLLKLHSICDLICIWCEEVIFSCLCPHTNNYFSIYWILSTLICNTCSIILGSISEHGIFIYCYSNIPKSYLLYLYCNSWYVVWLTSLHFFNIVLVITDLRGFIYTLESACQISPNKATSVWVFIRIYKLIWEELNLYYIK